MERHQVCVQEWIAKEISTALGEYEKHFVISSTKALRVRAFLLKFLLSIQKFAKAPCLNQGQHDSFSRSNLNANLVFLPQYSTKSSVCYSTASKPWKSTDGIGNDCSTDFSVDPWKFKINHNIFKATAKQARSDHYFKARIVTNGQGNFQPCTSFLMRNGS